MSLDLIKEKKWVFTVYFISLEMASQGKVGCDGSSFAIKSLCLVSLFLVLINIHVGCKNPSPSEMYGILKE